ncbi:hypothetical protein IFM89_009004 [Coptis chinensis]|uniref:Uncharacterized protein n=1 Tax=Coptis chinensis TaxID=261450 RepID=A0A835HLW0_9MAGN|nr:hypothetical protein IFM89_009004 [Coptis chinensis]
MKFLSKVWYVGCVETFRVLVGDTIDRVFGSLVCAEIFRYFDGDRIYFKFQPI